MGHNSDDQIEAAWCILNLAAGSPAHTAAAAHASPYLVSLLSSPVPLLQETSAWALGNFAGDSVQFRDVVAAQGAIIPLVRILMQSVDPALVKAASFALGNLARGAHAPIALMVEAQIIPALIRQLQYWQQQPGGLAVFCQIAWILTYLSAVDSLRHVLLPLNVLPLMAAGVFLVFDAVFTSEQHSGKPCEVSLNDATPLLRVMGNFATMDNDNVTNAIMSSHASWLDLLVLVMSTEHSGHLIAETAWLLGNLTTSNATGVVDSLVAAGFIPLLLEQLKRPKVPHESPAAALIEGLQNHPNARIGQLTEALYLNFLEPKEAEYDDDDHDDHDDDDR
ncbi:hypothetical protein CAOG_08200 [Capsaspora owczarzaki ATCC 30864]|uniref:hypothetical protein n=1 Tax=Capsaspora owczarzaki (strain ATCC 30864) TaxID=595528 RepID=UPI0001FE4FF9|nr:hypothetical protein CAOG_08200 [Capsaspora owczarzaki ATCC 30864]|eukprot:XP_004342455.1 hypothetical protein CAOG_08200 [Capsaspora owczarzaki ATCC 30864]